MIIDRITFTLPNTNVSNIVIITMIQFYITIMWKSPNDQSQDLKVNRWSPEAASIDISII